MVTYAGGRNERFQNDLKAITEAYEEVKRVLQIANVMINLETLKNTGKLREDTDLIIQRKFQHFRIHRSLDHSDVGNLLGGC